MIQKAEVDPNKPHQKIVVEVALDPKSNLEVEAGLRELEEVYPYLAINLGKKREEIAPEVRV